MTISRWILSRKRNVLDKSCGQNQNTHFMFSNFFFFRKSCRLWDNVETYRGARGATNDVSIYPIRVVCWISKATCTHTPRHTHARAHTHIILFHMNTPQCYVILPLPVLLRRITVPVILNLGFGWSWVVSFRCPDCFTFVQWNPPLSPVPI
jgi:hypothetical protein